MRARYVAAAALAVALAAIPASAGDVGRLYGTVVDENGSPLEGVSITVTGHGAVGVSVARTDAAGFYSVQGLPLREPLEVEARLPGKVTVIYSGLLARDIHGERRDFRLRPAGHHEFLILTQPGVPAYRIALDGVLTLLPGTSTALELTGDGPADSQRLREALGGSPNAVVAIGGYAASLARRRVKSVPVVATMVLDPRKEDLTTRNMCGFVANGGFADQIDQLQKVAPGASRILTVYNPRHLDRNVRSLRSILEHRGMTLVALSANAPKDVGPALESVRGERFDALLLLYDPGLTTPAAVQEIVRFGLSSGWVLIVPDPSMVQEGQVFSYAPGFNEMGVRAAWLVRDILAGRTSPESAGFAYPRARTLTLGKKDGTFERRD